MAWAHLQQGSASVKKELTPEEIIRIFSVDGEEFECSRDLLRYIKSFNSSGEPPKN
jgi:hypothetical protein